MRDRSRAAAFVPLGLALSLCLRLIALVILLAVTGGIAPLVRF